MPTYVCSLAEGSVNDDQKEAIARALSGIHSEETGAPSYFVQVVIEEKKPTQRFLGGTRVSGQIWIRGDIRAGRTEEQRNAMMLRMMEEVGRITGVQDQDIWIYLCNLAPTDMVEYGHCCPSRARRPLGMTVCLRLSRTISRASAQPKKASSYDCRSKGVPGARRWLQRRGNTFATLIA